MLPFLSALLLSCSSRSGLNGKLDLLFDLFYFSPSSAGTINAEGVTLMIITLLRGYGILVKDISSSNQMAAFSVERIEQKIAKELFPDPSNPSVCKEAFIEWASGLVTELKEADYGNLSKIYSLVQ